MVVENVRGAQKWVGKAQDHFGSFYLWGDVPTLMPQQIRARKNNEIGGSWFALPPAGWHCAAKNNPDGRKGIPHRTAGHWTNPAGHEGVKQGGDWFNSSQPWISRLYSSKSPQRKFASAMIAKIPPTLARHVAQYYYPKTPSLPRTRAPEASEVASPGGRQCPSDTSASSGG